MPGSIAGKSIVIPGLEIQNRRGLLKHAPHGSSAGSGGREEARLIVECVPNFSEGRDPVIVACDRAGGFRGAWRLLLDTTSDQDHNRSVLTFAGSAGSVADAAVAAVRAAVEKIDLTTARRRASEARRGGCDSVRAGGRHRRWTNAPRSLATLGARIWNELRVPVYLYEAAALRPECKRLENVRKLAPTGFAPDFGEGRHPTAGASVVGARKVPDRLEHQSAHDRSSRRRGRSRARFANPPADCPR